MAEKKITLKKWAEQFDPAPHQNTLLNWTRNGQIFPCPVKMGRSYYVQASAKHLAEIQNGPSTQIA